MDRCAILVDAGYLLGAAGSRLVGTPSRSKLDVDFEALLDIIRELAAQQTNLPLLRVLWYDAAEGNSPTAEQRSIANLPDVKVRLGELVTHGGVTRQKGVDAFLLRDIATLSVNKAVSDIILITGDDDMRRGVDEAQDHGIRVHLWGVEAAEQQYSQSKRLIMEADRRFLLRADILADAIRPKAPKPVPGRVESPTVHESQLNDDSNLASAAIGSLPSGGEKTAPTPEVETSSSSSSIPRPTELPRVGAMRSSDGFAGVHYYPAEPRFRPLRDMSTASQVFDDSEYDNAHPEDEPYRLGVRYAQRWLDRAEPEEIEAIRERHRRDGVPHQIDGDLLRYAGSASAAVDTWTDDTKFAIREGFVETVLAS